MAPINEEDEGTPKEMYFKAAQLGASYANRAGSNVCARFYPTCRYNSEQLIDIFVTEDVQENEIGEEEQQPAIHLQPPVQQSYRQPFYQKPVAPFTPGQPIKTHPAVSKIVHQVQRPFNSTVRHRPVAPPAV